MLMRWSSLQFTYERNMNFKVNEQARPLKQNKLEDGFNYIFMGKN